MFVFLVRLRWVGKEEEGGDLLSAQKVLRGEIFGSRRSQSCSGNRLSSSNDWTDPGRLTGWQIFVLFADNLFSSFFLLRSPPRIHDSLRNLCFISDSWLNPFFRSPPTPVCVNLPNEKLQGCEGCQNILSLLDFNWHTLQADFFKLLF